MDRKGFAASLPPTDWSISPYQYILKQEAKGVCTAISKHRENHSSTGEERHVVREGFPAKPSVTHV